MSSFIGHGLAALAINQAFESEKTLKERLLWQSCLLLCVYAPDIDYAINSLNLVQNNGLRITHTIAFSLIAPVILIVLLFLFDRKNLFSRGLQACLAGMSHLFLDLLVGSRNGDPLFYPLSKAKIILPFGILPSAGAISFSNYYFYRNTLIEAGILVPAFVFILAILGKLKINKLVGFGLFCVFALSLIASISLKR